MSARLPELTLVLGGAASGKSDFAERLARSFARPKTYVATAIAFDAEMERKVAEHQSTRGDDWITIEAPKDLVAALRVVDPTHVVLIDCLTLWLSNHLLEGAKTGPLADALLATLTATSAPVICVSNEAGMGLVPETALGRTFRNAQGRLNRKIAEQADLVTFVAAGLPLTLKGQLPPGMS